MGLGAAGQNSLGQGQVTQEGITLLKCSLGPENRGKVCP